MNWKSFFLSSVFFLSSSACYADYAKGVEALQVGNYTLAAQELTSAVDENDPKAQYLMGYLYYQGQGVFQDDEKAFELFRKATEQGHVEAQTFLGFMYDAGRGVLQDKKKAFDLYKASAEEGDITATINLGVMYYKGEGIPQNYDRAFELLNEIEHVHSPVLQLYLGNLYFYGYGVRQDINKAVSYYMRAAALGDVTAHYFLGSIYQRGNNVIKKDPAQAVAFYTYAAQKGDPNAQYNLATIYAGGENGEVDKIQAYAWLFMASEQNMEEANEALEKLEDTMSLSEISRAKNYILDLQKIDPNKVVSPVPPLRTTSIYSMPNGVGVLESSETPTNSSTIRRSKRMIRRR